MSRPPNITRSRVAQGLLWTSRVLSAATFLLAMMTRSWESGLFVLLPLFRFSTGGHSYQVGALAVLPLLVGGIWAIARWLERPRRRWGWGPAHLALPLFGLGALALVRIWPVHIAHTAAITAVGILAFWSAYLYVLQDWPQRWVVGAFALLLLIQGSVATVQFLRQGSVGLYWMGELRLDPQAQGASVIEAEGRRWLRAQGLLMHPNVLGGYLSMCLLVCLGAAAAGSKALWAPIALGAAGLFFTFSRAAWGGALAGAAYMAVVVRPWRRIRWRSAVVRRRLVLSSVVAVVCAALLWAAYGDLVATRLLRLRNPLEATSIQERIHDYRQAWGLIRDVPLKGTGSGYYVDALWAGVGDDRPPGFRHVHNVFLLATAELGLGGGLLWLALLLSPPIYLVVRAKGSRDLPVAAGLAAAFVSAGVISMLDAYLYVVSTWWSSLYLGILAGAWASAASALRPAEERL